MNVKVSSEVGRNCFYQAVMQACSALGRTLEESGRQELARIIEENNGFPIRKLHQIPRLLKSIGPYEFFYGGQKFTLAGRNPIIFIRPSIPAKIDGYTAVFCYADAYLLEHEILALLKFKRRTLWYRIESILYRYFTFILSRLPKLSRWR